MIFLETIKRLIPTVGRTRLPGKKYLASLASNPGTYRSARWSLRTFLRLHLGAKAWADLIAKQPSVANGKPRRVDLREVSAVERYPWQGLDREAFLSVRDALRAEEFSDSVVLKVLTAARGPVRRAAAMGLRVHDIDFLPGERPWVKTKRRGRWLTQDEVTRWLRACAWLELTARQPLYWIRVAACFALQLGAGLRSAEVLKASIEDIKPETRTIFTKDAKGGDGRARFRREFRPALEWVMRWIDPRGPGAGPLINALSRELVAMPVPYRRWGYQSLEEAYCYVAKVAGVEPFTSHDLRRTFATDTISATRDVRKAQDALRHKTVNGTMAYDLRDLDSDEDEQRPTLRFPTVAEVFASVKRDSFRVEHERRSR